MKSAELENLVKTRHLTEDPPMPGEIHDSLERAANLLLDAKRAVTSDGRFSLTYDSAYAYARAALRKAGYRASARYMAFQCLMHTTNISRQDWQVFNDAHTARNKIAYEGEPLEHFAQMHTDLIEALMRVTDRLAGYLDDLEPDGEQVQTAPPPPPAPS